MRHIIQEHIKAFLKDRSMVILSAIVILIGIIYIIYLAFSLRQSDLLIATHYTAFGTMQLYRTGWFYLFSFMGMALVIVIAHLSLMVKLHGRELRPLAVGLGWMTVIIFALLFLVTRSILGIAYL